MKKIIWLLSAVFVGVYICRPIADPDVWWHLVVGRWILAHHQIPSVDMWGMFSSGQPWRAYSWSNEIIYAFFDNHFGIAGVASLHFVLGALLALSFFYCLGRLARNWFVGALLGLIATAACVEHFSLRPQTVTWICLTWALLEGALVKEKGVSVRSALALAAIFCAWANTHISTALGIAALAGWIWDGRNTRTTIAAVLCAFLGTLITPYFGGEWLTFFSKADHPLTFATISEFQPATILHYATGFAVLLIILSLAFAWKLSSVAISIPRVLIVAVFVLVGFAVVKFLPMASIMLVSFAASLWASGHAEGGSLGQFDEALDRLQRLTGRFLGSGLVFLLLCLIAVKAHSVLVAPVDEKANPVAAVNFIKTHNLPHPILNAFGQGGYLMHAFSHPDGTLSHPVAVDGRTNLISAKLWRSYNASFEGREQWRDYLELVKPQTILWPSERPLNALLLLEGNWCRVFTSGSDGYSVYVLKSYVETRVGEKSLRCL